MESNSDIDVNRDKGFLFKQDLKKNVAKFGIFLNSGSPVIAEQLSYAGDDGLLVDMQHGPMNYVLLGSMLSAIANGKARSMVRVAGSFDTQGIQQALDLGADGILIPYVNTKEEAQQAISSCLYPTKGTRSVYFPQRATNQDGLLGYCGNANKNVIIAVQVETADCIKNIEEIASLPGLDILFLGQNDLCMSMGLYEKYVFPLMYTSPELNEATQKLVEAAKKNGVTCGVFLFGTDRVEEFLKLGFPFVSVGNDLHHVMTQSGTHLAKIGDVVKSLKN